MLQLYARERIGWFLEAYTWQRHHQMRWYLVTSMYMHVTCKTQVLPLHYAVMMESVVIATYWGTVVWLVHECNCMGDHKFYVSNLI